MGTCVGYTTEREAGDELQSSERMWKSLACVLKREEIPSEWAVCLSMGVTLCPEKGMSLKWLKSFIYLSFWMTRE